MDAQKILVVPSRITDIVGFSALPEIQQEIHAISTHHTAKILDEPARWIDMIRAVTGEDVFDIIHYAGHLSGAGLVLGSEIIPGNLLNLMIQTAKPKLVFINSCSSEEMAERIATHCSSDVICTIADIENSDAISFAISFYSTLSKHKTYRSAFDACATGESKYRYIEGKRTVVFRNDQLLNDVAELKRFVFGLYDGNGLVQRMSRIEEYLPLLRTLSSSKPTISQSTFHIITLSVLLFAILVWALAYRGRL